MDKYMALARLVRCQIREVTQLRNMTLSQRSRLSTSSHCFQSERRKSRIKTSKKNDIIGTDSATKDKIGIEDTDTSLKQPNLPVAVQILQSRISDPPSTMTESSTIDLTLKDLDKKIEFMKSEIERLELEKKKEAVDPEYEMKKALLSKGDPLVKPSTVPCGGCGAFLHCTNAGIPGFIPAHMFKEASELELGTMKCRRCEILGKNKAFNLELDEDIYEKVITRINLDSKALVLMLVDVTDIPNTLIKDYITGMNRSNPVIIVGNKIDLIPSDVGGWKHLNSISDRIMDECRRLKIDPEAGDIKAIYLISAKTGFGVEELISKLVKTWGTKGNVYLVGSTNSGKSTLFNLFLQSDYCKSSCRDVVQRATISKWPGTTFDLIKFPLAKLHPYDLFLRAERLKHMYKGDVEVRKRKKEFFMRYGKSKSLVLFGSVGKTDFRTDKQIEEDERKFTMTGHQFSEYTQIDNAALEDGFCYEGTNIGLHDFSEKLRVIKTEEYPESSWVFDTPGLINKEQLINCMTPAELQLVLQTGMIRPRVFTIKPGDTMFVTGMARIDYIQGAHTTLATVHIHHSLPVRVVKTVEADKFYMEKRDDPEEWDFLFKIPIIDQDRLDKLPPFEGKHFTFSLSRHVIAEVDIQLSSLGWVSFAGNTRNADAEVKVSTISGKGIHMRSPAMLPNILTFKGTRIKDTQGYSLRKLNPRIFKEDKKKKDGKRNNMDNESDFKEIDDNGKIDNNVNDGADYCKVEKLFPD